MNRKWRPEDIRSAQFIDVYYPVVDGVVGTVNNYAKLMNEISYSCVVCPDEYGDYDDGKFSYDILRAVALKSQKLYYSIGLPQLDPTLKKKLSEKKPDILHTHSPFLMGGYALALSKSLNLPLVATFHSKYYDDVYNVTKSKVASRTVTDIVVNFYNRCDSVWACSEGTAETLRSYGYKKDIFIMDNGTDFKLPDKAAQEKLKAAAADKFSIKSDKRTLLFVGHQIWHKNIKLVLDTFRKLCDDGDEYRLIIAGEGYDGEAIKKYADSLKFNPGQLTFTGKILDRDLLTGVYLNSDLFFFPSVYDNAPLVVREAAACSLPSLLTEGSNAAASVKKDVNGFTAKEDTDSMYKEIKAIFADPDRLKSVGQRAKETIPIPWSELIPRVYEKYAQVIEEHEK